VTKTNEARQLDLDKWQIIYVWCKCGTKHWVRCHRAQVIEVSWLVLLPLWRFVSSQHDM